MSPFFYRFFERYSLGEIPTFFLNSSLQELECCVEQLLQTMKGRRFVLANSDSCPPHVAYEKFSKVSEILRRQDI